MVNTNKKGLGKTLIKVRALLIMFEAIQREPDTGQIFRSVGRETVPVTS